MYIYKVLLFVLYILEKGIIIFYFVHKSLYSETLCCKGLLRLPYVEIVLLLLTKGFCLEKNFMCTFTFWALGIDYSDFYKEILLS